MERTKRKVGSFSYFKLHAFFSYVSTYPKPMTDGYILSFTSYSSAFVDLRLLQSQTQVLQRFLKQHRPSCLPTFQLSYNWWPTKDATRVGHGDGWYQGSIEGGAFSELKRVTLCFSWQGPSEERGDGPLANSTWKRSNEPLEE